MAHYKAKKLIPALDNITDKETQERLMRWWSPVELGSIRKVDDKIEREAAVRALELNNLDKDI